MSTIYRYLDVLSVEKCIDNINDFIKIKRIFIIMSVILFFLLYLCKRKQKLLPNCSHMYTDIRRLVAFSFTPRYKRPYGLELLFIFN